MFLCDGSWRRNFLAHTQTSEYSHRHICNAGSLLRPSLLAVLWTFPDVVRPPINTPLPNSSFCTAPLARVYIIPCWALRLLNAAWCVISSLQLFDPFIYSLYTAVFLLHFTSALIGHRRRAIMDQSMNPMDEREPLPTRSNIEVDSQMVSRCNRFSLRICSDLTSRVPVSTTVRMMRMREKIPGEWLPCLGNAKNNWANQRVGSSHMHPVKRSGMLTDLVMHSDSGCMSLSSSVTDYPFEYGKF